MEAILKFDLDDPDDRHNHEMAVKGSDAYLCLYKIDNYLRNKLKYENLSDEVTQELESLREMILETTHDEGVRFNQ